MSPRLLALLATDAPPGDCGLSGRNDGERLSSPTDLADEFSLKSCEDSCGGAFLECLNVSDSGGGLLGVRADDGGCSAMGVVVVDCLCARFRVEACEDCEAVEPCDWRRLSGKRPSFVRLHGWK
jgi:hypothetical protein